MRTFKILWGILGNIFAHILPLLHHVAHSSSRNVVLMKRGFIIVSFNKKFVSQVISEYEIHFGGDDSSFF
jgi:hypothetical protein